MIAANSVLVYLKRPTAVLLAAGVLLLWVYWPVLTELQQRWAHDPQYSHGYLVPVFAVVLLWHRRDPTSRVPLQSNGGGILAAAAGMLLYVAGGCLYSDWLEALSLLVCLSGLALFLGGWPSLRWAWPAVAFLIFMLPLPYGLETAVSSPLRRLATLGSTEALQTLGCPATAEGNVIVLREDRLDVEEACSGLSMLLTLLAASTAFACVVERPVLDKVALVASATPIAVFVNIVRITTMAILHDTAGSRAAFLFHDWGGWLMMVLAFFLLWAEMKLLAKLLVEPDKLRRTPVPTAVSDLYQ